MPGQPPPWAQGFPWLDPRAGPAAAQAPPAGGGFAPADSGYSAAVLADSPSAYYRLGDQYGSAAAVPTAGPANATQTGTVVFGQPGGLTGDSNTAVWFPATGTDYLQTSTSPGAAYDLGDGPFTIEFCYRWSGLTGGQAIANVLGKGTGAYVVRLNSTSKWLVRKSGTGDCFVTTASFTDTSAWHHVVITRALASQPHIYVDGADQAGTHTAQTFADATTGFAIGVDAAAKTTGAWAGLLDEVALYKSVLPPARVTAHYLAFLAQGAAGPPVYPLGHPVAARRLPQRGGSAVSHGGVFTAAGVPQAGPPVYPPGRPVQARALPAQGGRTASRHGTYGQAGPPVYPLHGPVQARRLPQRGGSTSSRAGTPGRTGPPVKPASGPGRAQPGPLRGGRTASRAGTYTVVVTGSGPPVYPLGRPVQARRQPAVGGRVVRRAGTYQGTGAPAVPLRQPTGVQRQQQQPPARGRVQSQRGPYRQTGPPAVRLRRPVRGQPQRPLLTGRAAWRAGTYTAPFVPPFTIGALTAADKGTSALTAAGASNTLTAGTAPSSTLTAGTQKTGGPA